MEKCNNGPYGKPISGKNNESDNDLSNASVESASVADLLEQISTLEQKHAALKQHTSQLAELSDTAADMMRQDSLKNLLQFIADEMVRLSCANGAYLHMVHETGDYLHVVAACGAHKNQLMGNTRKRGFGLSAQAWETGTFQYTDNYNKDSCRVVEFPEELKAVALPLLFSNRISGVAFVTAPVTEDLYSQISILKEIAKTASIAIYNTEQIEAQAFELQRIKALSVLGDTLYQSTDWDSILNSVCQHLFDILDIKQVTIYQWSEKLDQLRTYCARQKIDGSINEHQPAVQSLREHSISNWCFENNEFAQIDRHIEDARESAELRDYNQKNNIGSTMCVPLSYHEKPWGVATIHKSDSQRNFNESDANAFRAMASQVSTALQRNVLVSKVHHQAFHDSLTNLPNRRSFEEHFSTLINDQSDMKFAILFCDLDGFKAVNDTHGHDVGDKVLRICASRMDNCIRHGDYLARMGGDEFAVIVKLSGVEHDTGILAKRLLITIGEQIQVKNLCIQVGLSIGISFYPDDGTTFSELLNHADVAMYQAKHAGKGKILHYNKQDSEVIRKKNELRSALREALSRNEFELWYQPQVAWRTNRVCGVEALLRWNHPQLGNVPPYEFIPIAEESGLIDKLGLWILEEAVTTFRSWQLPANKVFCMGVNIAPPQFLDEAFSTNVLNILKKYNVRPEQLKVEITESFIMNDRDSVVLQLKHLRENGVLVAIDDFGTGYSSLSYLQDLPIDVLKIDRAFVSSLAQDNYKTSIAASIMALANSLGLTTITEGVETDEQLYFIQQLGSETIQGYYYSKPVPASKILDVVHSIEHSKNDVSKAS